MAELVDAADLKSVGRKAVPVRFRPSAPDFMLEYQALNLRVGALFPDPLIFLNPYKTIVYIFALLKIMTGEQND